MKALLVGFILLLAMTGTALAQTRTRPASSTPASAPVNRPDPAVRQRAKDDSIRQVQALAREMARQMMLEDSIRKARQSVANRSAQPTVAATTQTVSQRNATPPKGVVSIGPSVLINSDLESTQIGGSVGVGYAVGRKLGILLSGDYVSGNQQVRYNGYRLPSGVSPVYTHKSVAFAVRPEVRFYPKRAFDGFFVGLGGGFMSYTVGTYRDIIPDTQTESAANAGLALGVTINTPSRLSLELGLLGSVAAVSRYSFFVGQANFRVGYAF